MITKGKSEYKTKVGFANSINSGNGFGEKSFFYTTHIGINFGAAYLFAPFMLSTYYSAGFVHTRPYDRAYPERRSNFKERHRSFGFTLSYDLKSAGKTNTWHTLEKLANNQKLGFRAGINIFNIKDHKAGYNDRGFLSPLPTIGSAYNNEFAPHFSFQTELYYTQKGDTYNYYTGFNRERTDTHVKMDFVEIPLLLRLQTNNEGTDVFVNSGVGFDFALGKIRIDTKKPVNSPNGFRRNINREIDNQTNKSFQIGAGISIPAKESDFVAEIRYIKGIEDVFSETSKTQVISTTAGFMFPLKKR